MRCDTRYRGGRVGLRTGAPVPQSTGRPPPPVPNENTRLIRVAISAREEGVGGGGRPFLRLLRRCIPGPLRRPRAGECGSAPAPFPPRLGPSPGQWAMPHVRHTRQSTGAGQGSGVTAAAVARIRWHSGLVVASRGPDSPCPVTTLSTPHHRGRRMSTG